MFEIWVGVGGEGSIIVTEILVFLGGVKVFNSKVSKSFKQPEF